MRGVFVILPSGDRKDVDLSVEIFNRTKYNDEILEECAAVAHRICGIEGDVAVIFRYHAHSTGYIGQMTPSHPYFREVARGLKKFQDKKYSLKRGDFNPRALNSTKDMVVEMATRDGAYGYIEVRMPRAKTYLNEIDAKNVMNTIMHEMFHIKQYRDADWALEDQGCSSWKEFCGYSGRRAAKRVAHQSRPIEQHVNRLLKDIQPTLEVDVDYMLAVKRLTVQMTSEKVVDKTKKQRQAVKYNKYGERMSDYRNVKMKKLRSGDVIVTCPHCGEQAVNLDGDVDTFTHIAAISDETVRYGGLTPAEARYTQFGHMIYSDGRVANVQWGYVEPGELDQDVFKNYGRRGYYA